MPTDRLVLWRWEEAEICDGDHDENWRSIGSQMKKVQQGDRLFFCATRDDELYLLGAMLVTAVGKERAPTVRAKFGSHYAEGTSLVPPFRIIPLGRLKARLRFQTGAPKLIPGIKLALLVLKHRVLTPQTADLLLKVLRTSKKRRQRAKPFLVKEGRRLEQALSTRERDPNVRRHALDYHGRRCMICGFDFAEVYGKWAAECVEVHHLHLLGTYPKGGGYTTQDDVIVVCPNCHRALHRFNDPSDWRELKRECELG